MTKVFAFLFALCSILFPALAQTPTGEITGLITDPSHAVVPNAKIDIMNADTGIHWRATSNQSGYYTVPLLPPGNYIINVESSGFKKVTRAGIPLAVAQVARIDFALEVGAATETVEVTEAAPLLESQSAALGQVVQTRVINDLPLNGRNYLQLAKLTAGVSEPQASDVGAPGGSFVANGVRAQLNNFNLDGTDNNTRIVDIQNQSYQVIQPSVDALQEFKVETSNYSAQYGYSAGAVVNASIKSGTNRFHGGVFEFLRNDHLDARDYFLSPSAPKQRHQRNQFGGTFGGPIVKDKTFFFASWERTAENLGLTMVQTLPDAAMRTGNLAGRNAIFDPDTTRSNPGGSGYIRDPFPGNLIPSTRISPVSAKLTALLPNPTSGALANNFVANPTQTDRVHRIDSRADHNFTDNDKLFARLSYLTRAFLNPGPFPAPLIGGTSNNQNLHSTQAHSATLGETHIFSGAAVNEFRAGYSRIFDLRGDLVSGPYLGPEFGFKGVPANPGIGVSGLPGISISGYSGMGETAYVPNGKVAEVLQFRDSVSWLRGNHALKAGGEFVWNRSYYNLSSSARGTFSFDGTFTQDPQNRSRTGNAFGDFLLGIPSTSSIAVPAIGDARTKYAGFFIQDDWKLTPKLTMNLGLRYEIWTWRYERNNLQGNFVPGMNQVIYPENKAPAGIPASIVGTIPSGVGSRTLLPADRNNISPRLGLAYQLSTKTVLRGGAGLFYASQAFPGAGATPLGSPPFLLTSNFPTDQVNPNVTFAGGFPADALAVKTVNPSSLAWQGFDIGMVEPYVWKWNFGVQREWAGFLLETNYVGTKGTQLPVYFDYNSPYPGGGSVVSRRPVPGFGSVQYTASMGNSEYHALESRLQRNFTNGLSLLLSYTHAKTIDYGGVQLGGGDVDFRDVRDIRAERALAAFDMRDRVSISYVYDLPFGRGRTFAVGNPVLAKVVGDWQVNGITTLHSGQPFTPTMGFSTANTGNSRPDRIANGNLPAGQRSIQKWFDKTAFAAAPLYEFGNAGRNILTGPGAVNFDFSVFKRIPVRRMGENGEVQFRAELFNLFNHPQFANPNARFDIPQGGTITSLANDMRQIQFGLKVLF